MGRGLRLLRKRVVEGPKQDINCGFPDRYGGKGIAGSLDSRHFSGEFNAEER
jgi:hypothetical protein